MVIKFLHDRVSSPKSPDQNRESSWSGSGSKAKKDSNKQNSNWDKWGDDELWESLNK